MGLIIKTTSKTEEAANFIALSISNQLKLKKHVLFFITGGSSISIGKKVSEILRKNLQDDLVKNLIIMLTDERYGPPKHKDSNWQQSIEQGFDIPKVKFIPILIGKDTSTTVNNFNTNLGQELAKADYKIALFGVGVDGHTAGILPNSDAVKSKDWAFGYQTPRFYRITITTKVIEKLNEAIIWMQGKEKWNVIKNLEKDIDINKQPVQILKKVPLLTFFTDYSNSKKS